MPDKITIPNSNYKKYIVSLGKKYNVNYVKTKSDELANIFTKLSDDEIVQDKIELLALQLKKENIITGKEMLLLLHGYLKEIRVKIIV